MKQILKDNKGSFAYFYVFVALSIILVLMFALFIPFSELFLQKTYTMSDKLLTDARIEAENISDANIKATVLATYDAQSSQIPDSIDVLSVFFQYGWLLIPLIIVLVLFLLSRQQVETTRLA